MTIEKWHTSTLQRHKKYFQLLFRAPAEECFPVAFSPDLSLVVVSTAVYRLTESSSPTTDLDTNLGISHYWSGKIPSPGPELQACNGLPMPRMLPPCSIEGFDRHQIAISQNNHYLAYFYTPRNLFEGFGDLFLIVYDLGKLPWITLVWETVFNEATFVPGTYFTRVPLDGIGLASVVFHPSRPIVAWSAESGTGIKHLGRKDFSWADGDETILTGRRPMLLENLQFSECGRFLNGRRASEAICLPVPQQILVVDDCNPAYGCEPESDDRYAVHHPSSAISHVPHSDSEICRTETNGTAYSLQIRHGAHLLRVDPVGNVETKTLARLPQDLGWDSKHTKVVLSRAHDAVAHQTSSMEIQLIEKSGALKAALFIRNCDLKADKLLFPVIYKRKVGDMEGEKPSDGCGGLEPQRVPKSW